MLRRTGAMVASDPCFQPPRTALKMDFYASHDGGFRTTYECEVANGDAVGDQGKARQYLKAGRLPREFLSKEAIQVGTAKARSDMPDGPVVLDPQVRRLMREIQKSEGTRQQVKMDPDTVDSIRRKHRVDHVTGIWSDPRRDSDDLTQYGLKHVDLVSKEERASIDKRNFNQKTFYTEYVEAYQRQRGLQADKK